MSKALAVLEQAIVVRTPVNTGLLRGATTSQKFGNPASMTGIVFNPLGYGMPVEFLFFQPQVKHGKS